MLWSARKADPGCNEVARAQAARYHTMQRTSVLNSHGEGLVDVFEKSIVIDSGARDGSSSEILTRIIAPAGSGFYAVVRRLAIPLRALMRLPVCATRGAARIYVVAITSSPGNEPGRTGDFSTQFCGDSCGHRRRRIYGRYPFRFDQEAVPIGSEYRSERVSEICLPVQRHQCTRRGRAAMQFDFCKAHQDPP